jgi:tetratricopeptide (TPR) repeat protein
MTPAVSPRGSKNVSRFPPAEIGAEITAEKLAAETAARAAASDRILVDRLVDIRSGKADDPYGTVADADYDRVFREAGIDVAALPPVEVGNAISKRPPAVAAAMVAALDNWSAARRSRRYNRPGALRLSEAALAADRDQWRAGLRRALDLEDQAARIKSLREIVASMQLDSAPAVDLDLLGTALSDAGESRLAEEVLRASRQRFHQDVWLNFDLARLLESTSRIEEAVRYYSIARALRPETAHELAHALEKKGESAEAAAAFRNLARSRPDNGRHWGCLGLLLKERGDPAGSRDALEKAVAILRKDSELPTFRTSRP